MLGLVILGALLIAVPASATTLKERALEHGHQLGTVETAESTKTKVVLRGQFAVQGPRGYAEATGTVATFTEPMNTILGEKALHLQLNNKAPVMPSTATVEAFPLVLPAKVSRLARRNETTTKAHKATWCAGSRCYGVCCHSYDNAQWQMGGSERVMGAQLADDPKENFMPEPCCNLDSDEMWIGMPNGYWMETGEAGGGFGSPTDMHWFYGWKNKTGYNSMWYGVIPWGSWAELGFQYVGNGAWCITSEPNWERCVSSHLGGFPSYATDLEDGMEIMSEYKPINYAAMTVSATWMDHTRHLWNRAAWSVDPGTCMAAYLPYPGDVLVATC